jgi:hypothetical protein
VAAPAACTYSRGSGSRLKLRADALRDSTNYDLMVGSDPPRWTAEQWQVHREQRALIMRIHPRDRFVLAEAVRGKRLSTEQVHGFICTGELPAALPVINPTAA